MDDGSISVNMDSTDLSLCADEVIDGYHFLRFKTQAIYTYHPLFPAE